MNNIAFTICAKNYTGLALILKKSIKQYYEDIDFYIFIADEFEEAITLPENTYVVKNLGIFNSSEWNELTFKYDLTEFCTCLKPYLFEWLMNKNDTCNVCYLDPDLFFFSSIENVFNKFNSYDILLTPHILQITNSDIQQTMERELKFAGIYNLGFLGLRKCSETLQILKWWQSRLYDKCFACWQRGEFTDQIWMDFITAFYKFPEKIYISHNLGWNFAPWNFYERKLFGDREVCLRNQQDVVEPIVFVHYSGINYKKLINGEIIQKTGTHSFISEDIERLLLIYGNYIKENKETLLKYINYKYSYNFFSNGEFINPFLRRLFHGLLLEKESFILNTNPFDSNGILYQLAKKNKLLIKKYSQPVLENTNNVTGKIKILQKIQKFFFRLLGVNKYLALNTYFSRATISEKQTYLIKK